jgi:hypothetical protein
MKNKLPRNLDELAILCRTIPKSNRKNMLRWKCPTIQDSSVASEAKP